jgi:hypothetical protein
VQLGRAVEASACSESHGTHLRAGWCDISVRAGATSRAWPAKRLPGAVEVALCGASTFLSILSILTVVDCEVDRDNTQRP